MKSNMSGFMHCPIIIDGVDTGYIVSWYGEIFEVLQDGTVREVPQYIGTHGYSTVTLHYNQESHQFLVHRLVANCYCAGKTDIRKYVNHIDGVKTHNVATNLEWVSNSENMRHAVLTGLHTQKGLERIYSTDQIHEVCRLLEECKLTHREISKKTGVDITLIRDIKFRGKHASISSQYNINHIPAGHKEFRHKILELMGEGLSNSEIAQMFPDISIRHIEYCRYIFNKSTNIKINGRYKRVDHRQAV